MYAPNPPEQKNHGRIRNQGNKTNIQSAEYGHSFDRENDQ
jgi:hypothetical protein